MNIKSILLKNWMPFEELNLDGLENRGLVALIGDNNSGKSAFGEAFVYASSGKLVRQASLAGVIRRGSEGGGCVAIESDVLNISAYRDHPQYGANVVLHFPETNAQITGSTTRSSRKLMAKVLPTGIATLGSVFFLLQPEALRPMFLFSGLQQRHEVLSELLEMGDYVSVSKAASQAAVKYEEDLRKKTLLRERLEGQLTELVLQSPGKELAVRGAQREVELVVQVEPKESSSKLVAQTTLDEIEGDIEMLMKSVEGLEYPAHEYISERKQTLLGIQAQTQRILDRLNSVNNFDKLVVGEQCPLCRGEGVITVDTIERYTTTVPALQILIKKLTEQATVIEKEIAAAKEKSEKIIKVSEAITCKKHDIARIEKMIERLDDETDTEQLAKDQLEAAKQRLLDANSEFEKHKKRVLELTDSVKETDDEVAYLQGWLDTFSLLKQAYARDIPTLRLSGVCSVLQDLTRSYLSGMGVDVEVKWSVENTLLNLVVDCSLDGNGINRCVALAVTLALGRISTRQLNIRFFDEVLYAMRRDLKRRCMQVLKDEAKRGGTIFLVPHGNGEEIIDLADEVIEFEQQNGVSRVVA